MPKPQVSFALLLMTSFLWAQVIIFFRGRVSYDSFIPNQKYVGLEPKSFYRSQNKFNYVYLERYNTIQEARNARDSKFFGKYAGKTWIFRVRRE